jgi:uncharacterized protein YerC
MGGAARPRPHLEGVKTMEWMTTVRKMVCSMIRNMDWREEAISDAYVGITKILTKRGEVSEGEVVKVSQNACRNVCRKHMKDPLLLSPDVLATLVKGFNPHDEIVARMELEDIANLLFTGDKLTIAGMIIQGLEPSEISSFTGYSPATISRVKTTFRGAYDATEAT